MTCSTHYVVLLLVVVRFNGWLKILSYYENAKWKHSSALSSNYSMHLVFDLNVTDSYCNPPSLWDPVCILLYIISTESSKVQETNSGPDVHYCCLYLGGGGGGGAGGERQL